MTKAEERALEAYQNERFISEDYADMCRSFFIEGYEQAEKDIKKAIVKYFKYKQDHSPEHTLHWWVYKDIIDKVNEL